MAEYSQMESDVPLEGLKVMICVDGSHNSELAFQYYMDYVHKTGNEVILAHVADLEIYPSSHIYSGGMGIGMPTGTTHEILDKAKKKNKLIETKFTAKCKNSGIGYKFLALMEGGHGLGAVLVQAAHDHNANTIVIGCRGHGVLRRTILGSVSDYVLHHSHVPTLICPKHE